MLRTTETGDEDVVKSTKEVMPRTETAKRWQVRNQTQMTKNSELTDVAMAGSTPTPSLRI